MDAITRGSSGLATAQHGRGTVAARQGAATSRTATIGPRRRLLVAVLVTCAAVSAISLVAGVRPAAAQDDDLIVCTTNDDFDCRSPISLDTPEVAHNGAATFENAEFFVCGDPTGATLWWSWTAPSDLEIVIDTFGTAMETIVTVFEVPVGAANLNELDPIDCNADSFGATTGFVFDALAGVEYAIQVDGTDDSIGPIQLNLAEYQQPIYELSARCIDGAGIISLTTTNLIAAPLDIFFYVVNEVRFERLASGETATLSVTGRHDGVYGVDAYASDSLLVSGDVTVDCLPNPAGPAALVSVGCLAERGILRFNLVADENNHTTFEVEVAGISTRSVELLAGQESSLPISGRADGFYEWSVRDVGIGFETSGIAEVDCVPQSPEPSAAIAVTCGSEPGLTAGVITALITASTNGPVDFVVRVLGLDDRALRVDAAETRTIARSGRADGVYDVEVLADGVLVASEAVQVRCRPDYPETVITQTCANERGVIAVDLFGDPWVNTTYFVTVEGLDTREIDLEPDESAKDVRTGRPNGSYFVEIYGAFDDQSYGYTVASHNVSFDCDPNQACDIDGVSVIGSLPRSECQALLEISDANPDLREFYGWGEAVDPCRWSGVSCTAGRVHQLYLFGQGIDVLPAAIRGLPLLRGLTLDRTSVTMLPAEIGTLSDLTNLSVQGGVLTELPEEIGNLTSLRQLQLARNQLTALPEGLASLTDLNFLDVSENDLRALPDLTGLSQLRELVACGQGQALEIAPETLEFLAGLDFTDHALLRCYFPAGYGDIRTSCIDGRGVVASTFVNDDRRSAVVRFTVSGLDPLVVTLAPGEAYTATRTGRINGVYAVGIEVNGYDIATALYEVYCEQPVI